MADTVINNRNYYLITIALKNNSIINDGSIQKLTAARSNYYTIIIDRENLLPYQIITSSEVNKDFTKTTFENLKK